MSGPALGEISVKSLRLVTGYQLLPIFLLFVALQASAQGTSNSFAPQTGLFPVPVPALARPGNLPNAFRQDTPASLADLRFMEKHVRNLVGQVSPAVVAVRVGGSTGSGVVISADGLVLCAAHVCGQPNREVRFTFPNGRSARGTTLGTDHEMDAGLMRITDKGPWPHASIGQVTQSSLGDWVLALGHPGGFDAQRPAVVRLGRIISLTQSALRTDCTLLGGDSGGPLFDMYGRVIGIHSRISESTAENFHVPIARYVETWVRLAKGENWGGSAGSSIGAGYADHPDGCQLNRIDENGPAFKAGLRVGDVVTKMNGRTIKNSGAFRQYVRQSKPGESITLEVKRETEKLFIKVIVEMRSRRGRTFGAPWP
ncbi:MAG: S1C family serine protease [Verrucomicrobiales bacterium]|nr:S1C family serine protease [Verrucomicrobiales bacterium]